MNIENSRLIKKTICSIVAVAAIFIVAFIEVPRVYRNLPFYYFLAMLSIGAASLFLADIIVKPKYKTIGQKLAFHSIPIFSLATIIILKVLFTIFNIGFVYYIILTLLVTVILYSTLFNLSKGFDYINHMNAQDHAVKISEGIKKIRMDEIAAQVKLNTVLEQNKTFKTEFQLLVNEVKYANPTELKETEGISIQINTNIEKLSEIISQVVDDEKINDLKVLLIDTRAMIKEKNKIAQLYYKKI